MRNDAPKKIHFYALRSRGSKSDEGEDDDGKLFYFSLKCYEFVISGGVWLVARLNGR